MSHLILVLIISAAACLVTPCCGKHHYDLPRKWVADDKRPAQTPPMDPCNKERSMNMICHCEKKLATQVQAAECWILKNDFTINDPLWKSLERYSAITELKFIVQSGSLNFIPTMVLKTLTKLEDLSISFSNVHFLKGFAFANSSSLRTIRLNHNDLTAIEKFAFSNLNNLVKVDLQSNNISKIDSKSFVNLTNLEYLALSDNKLTELPTGSFRALNNLLELQLQHNLLETIVSDIFLGLENVRVLKLSSNKITSIGDGAFIELWSLTELYLDNNKIEKISERAFDGLNNLRRLSLQRNRLRHVEKSLFTSLPVIHWLNLANNRLQKLEQVSFSYIFDNFVKVDSTLTLGGNEFICDCNLSWLINFRNQTKSITTQQSIENLKCLITHSASHDIPEAFLMNAMEIHNSSDNVDYTDTVGTDRVQVRYADLDEGSIVNLFQLDEIPCHEDASNPTSLPLPRESTGYRDSGISLHKSWETFIILLAFVICVT